MNAQDSCICLVAAKYFVPQLHSRCSRSNSFQISLNFTKIWEAISENLFLFVGAGHFFHNLFMPAAGIEPVTYALRVRCSTD